MRRTWVRTAFVAALVLAWTGGVQAREGSPLEHPERDEPPAQHSKAEVQAGKAFGMVDLYLVSATNNLKVLSSLADLPPATTDKQIVREASANLGMALDRATVHLKLARKVADLDAAMVEQLAELERHLNEARAAGKKLGKTKLADMGQAVDVVATHVMAADQVFGKIALAAGITRLETMRLGTAPVRGRGIKGVEGVDGTVTPKDFTRDPTPQVDPQDNPLPPPPVRDGAPPSSSGKNYP